MLFAGEAKADRLIAVYCRGIFSKGTQAYGQAREVGAAVRQRFEQHLFSVPFAAAMGVHNNKSKPQ